MYLGTALSHRLRLTPVTHKRLLESRSENVRAFPFWSQNDERQRHPAPSQQCQLTKIQNFALCKIQRHLGLPGSTILKVVSLVSRLLDREALAHVHQHKSKRSLKREVEASSSFVSLLL